MIAAAIGTGLLAGAALLVARRAAATPRRSRLSGSCRSRIPPARQRARAAAELPAALEVVAQSLRAGCSVRDGVMAAAGSSPHLAAELDDVQADLDAGTTTRAGFDRWAARSTLPGVDLAAAAVEVSVRGGGSIARALDGVAATVRDRQRLTADVRSLATQARLSAAVLAAAPPAFAVVLVGGDASVAGFLAGSAAGWLCLAAGLGLDVAGWVWMRRICGAVR